MAKSPLQLVKETFGEKAKLIEALQKLAGPELWVDRTNNAKGLARVTNAKLLRLHTTFTAVKEKFTTRAALVDAVLTLEGRSKDDGYRSKLTEYSVPRLFDQWKSSQKRSTAAKGKSSTPPAAKKQAASPAAKTKAKQTALPAPKKA